MYFRALAPLVCLASLALTTGCSSSKDAAKNAACPPTVGCNESCVIGSSDVSKVVDGCTVTECCVPGGEDAGTDAGPGDASTTDADSTDAGPGDASTTDGGLFACGAALTCDGRTQYCSAVSPPHSSPNYGCVAVPSACTSDVTCACFATQGLGSGCAESNGDVTVTELEP